MIEKRGITLIRQAIVVIVLSTVVLLGWPLIQKTTTIYRADLPIQQVNELASSFVQNVHFKIPVYLDVPNVLEHFIPTAQKAIDTELYSKYPSLQGFWSLDIQQSNEQIDENEQYVVKFEIADSTKNPESKGSYFASPFTKATTLHLTEQIVAANKVSEFLNIVLLDTIFASEIKQMVELAEDQPQPKSAEADLIIPYSSKYNIVFTLLVENGKTVSWDIEKSLALLQPTFDKLKHFTNFSISSQIQYYSKVATPIKYDESNNAYVIPTQDLSTFINFGDWNLITHDISPTINFLTYFPESNYENIPVIIENSLTNSFLVPQWGGVKIFNKRDVQEGHLVAISETDLIPVLEVFTSQLFQLLGLTETPKSPSVRIDTLSRVVFFKNVKQSLDNLRSLIKLTESLNEISVPDLTKNYVYKALSSIEQSVESLQQNQNYSKSMEFSAKALEYSDSAFFEKQMVQQAYFPSEHKLAVFLPLVGPVCSIVFIGFLKLVSDKRKERAKKDK